MTASTLRMTGPGLRGARVAAALLRDALNLLIEASRATVRLRLEGRSTAPGPAPGWVNQATAFDVVAIREGSTQLVIDAPPLAQAAPDQFAQGRLFEEIDGGQSCIDLLGESLADAVASRPDSELYDDKLLTVFSSFGRLFRAGVDRIELAADRMVCVDERAIVRLESLRRDIPADQRTLVAGTLDELRHRDRRFTLVLDDGRALKGVLGDSVAMDRLGSLWGKVARVAGVVKFRPSGAVLRVEAESVERATGDVSLWSGMPRPLFEDLDPKALRVSQGPRSGVSAIFGRWPGDETDEEFDRVVAELA